MGERLNGIQEVGSSILPGSTNIKLSAKAPPFGAAFSFSLPVYQDEDHDDQHDQYQDLDQEMDA